MNMQNKLMTGTKTINLKIAISALLLFSFCSSTIISNKITAASAGFDSGRIIDDAVFYNPYSMTTEQIQAFLNSKLSTCDTYGGGDTSYYFNPDSGALGYNNDEVHGTWVTTSRALYGSRYNTYWNRSDSGAPFTCLKNLSSVTVAKAADAYCSGYGVYTQSTAEIINGVAKSCRINPQVLLVLLQKESGVLTDTWPMGVQYSKATGMGCSDYAPCTPEYLGFFNQIYDAARQFKKYRLNPYEYNYVAGRNNLIQWCEIEACGSGNVYIRNQATAGLYNYTPYQPNAAAIAANPGEEVYCGSYGNLNFWRLFTEWFGSTYNNAENINDQLITSGTSGGVFIVENGTKRPFPSEQAFLSYGNSWADVVAISEAELDQIPQGAVMPIFNVNNRSGQLVKTGASGGGVFIVENGTKRPFPSEQAFLSYGNSWADVVAISNKEIDQIPEGIGMPVFSSNNRNGQLIKTPYISGIYKVENGVKRAFPNELSFSSNGLSLNNVLTIGSAEFNLIPNGADMGYNAHYRDGRLILSANNGVFLVDNGTKRAFPSEQIFLSYSYKWADVINISDIELALIPDGSAMTYNVHHRDNSLIMSAALGVFLVDNGTKRAFPSEQIFLSYSYRWANVSTISTSELNLIPDGSDMSYNIHYRDGQLVLSSSYGVSLVEDGKKRAIPSEQVFLSYSYKWSYLVPVSDSELALIPDGPTLLYNTDFLNGKLISSPSVGVYLVDNGTKRAFPSEQIFLSYSYKWADVINISDIELALIPDGSAMTYNVHYRDNKVVTTATKGVFLVQNGTKRPFPDEQTFLSYSYTWLDLTRISDYELSLIPDGTAMTYKTI